MTHPHQRRRVISSAAGLSAGGLAFFLVLFNLGSNLGRTALGNGFFSGVYEIQARAILDGRISLPEGSMSIEGFVRDGQTNMYFPPFPALLRLPVMMTTDEFDGRLTLLSMVGAWIVLAVMTTKLAWLVLARVTGSDEVTRTGAALVGVFLACATGGTFVTYDAALPWVYHEVYLWAIAAAVGCLYWMIRILIAPDWHSARWLGLFAFAAIGTRATEGWAICLTVLGIALWMRLRPTTPAHRATWWAVLAAAAVPLALSIALNVYKFDHALMFPLQDQVWTSINEHRREALAANGGALTGPQFFTTSFMAYLRPDGIRFVDYFPWVTVPASPAASYNGAFVDQSYRTGSATPFMALLMVLMLVSVVVVFSRWAPRGARILRVPILSSVLITGGVMAYGYYATRYTSEFVPALVLGGAVGTALVVRLVTNAPRLRAPAVVITAGLTLFAILAQVAIGLSAAAYAARGEPLQRFLGWQQAASPDAQAGLVTTTEDLPQGGQTDELAIRGDCQGLYLNTGDAYEPWITVQQRDAALRIYPDGPRGSGSITLYRIPQTQESVLLETGSEGLRVVLSTPDGDLGGPFVKFPPQGYLQISVRNLTEFGSFEISMSQAGVIGYLRSNDHDEDWVTFPTSLDPAPISATEAGRLGVRIEDVVTLVPPLCDRLAARAGLELPGR